MRRRDRVIINQLRAGRSPLLFDFLFVAKYVDSPICPACEAHPDSVHHLLLDCPEYEGQRAYCLGGDATLSILENDPAAVIRFLKKTNRYETFIPEGRRLVAAPKRSGGAPPP